MGLFAYTPQFLLFIKALVRPIPFGCIIQCIEHIEQPIDDAIEIYDKNLALVHDFFTSKLHLYYASSRLTLLLAFLSATGFDYLGTDVIPLPSRLKITDKDALDLHTAGYCHTETRYWHIFQDFLNSNDPLALDERRYAVAAFACLEILFGHFQPPVSRITWFSQHSRTLRGRMEDQPQQHHKVLRMESYGARVAFYWHRRTCHRNQMPQKQSLWVTFDEFEREDRHQCWQTENLLFFLPKPAYSHDILNFARYRVFRFGYLRRNHPTYMKMAIFALAKYIERVTGEMVEVKACESIWGHETWFTA